ncbi:MAG: hypothetical protein EOO50_01460 [Flavobacterium sp.]|uniref:hypothetical protein n=1 Tax=Flavobacterium sp. TaxID=239 RepID=UPI001223B0C1|nr:hypothetical protein [Flavobacterium sp.]RZJ68486.1 MAG: hypothetical protein EOO50_01460 [Flavobacterium sp.]
MKAFFIAAAALLIVSCKNDSTAKPGDQPFFLFDKVEHYHTDVTEAQIEEIYAKPEKSRKELGMIQIVKGTVPTSARDTGFIENMSILGFSKHEVPTSKNEKISEIFSVKPSTGNPTESDCKQIFNDVLVFTLEGKVTGVAKLSFDCKKQQMVGIRYNPMNFGQNGEYEKLAALLK